MKRAHRLFSTLVCATSFACGGTGAPKPDADGGVGPSDGGAAIEVRLLRLGSSAPLYPYNPKRNEHVLVLNYEVRIEANGAADWQDVDLSLPMPEALGRGARMSVAGGFYSDVTRAARWTIDWLSPDMGALAFGVTIERDPKLFSDDASALAGDLDIRAHAEARQYGAALGRSAEAEALAYLPKRVSPQDFDVMGAGAVRDGALYLAARPRSGPNAGRGGVYRLPLGGGDLQLVVQHAARSDSIAHFCLTDSAIFYVTFTSDDGSSVLRSAAKDGRGTPKLVALPDGALRVHAVAADASSLFVVVERTDHAFVLYRTSLTGDGTGSAQSAPLGNLTRETIAVTKDFVFVLREDPPAIVRVQKSTLAAGELVTLGSTTGPRSVACNDGLCFWTEWYDGFLFQIPTTGGTKTKVTSTNQPIVLDERHVYSGINGLIRVGPANEPAAERLFAGSPLPVFATDASYVYFGVDGRVWRLHK